MSPFSLISLFFPFSPISPCLLQDAAARKALVAELHLLKTDLFMDLVDGGAMPLRPGVARLVGERLGSSGRGRGAGGAVGSEFGGWHRALVCDIGTRVNWVGTGDARNGDAPKTELRLAARQVSAS